MGYNGKSPGLKNVGINGFLPARCDLLEQLNKYTYSIEDKNEALR